MSLDYMRIARGLELDEQVTLLQGMGAPGASGDPSTVLVGSFYLDNNNGDVYSKITAGVGTDKWEKLASQSYVDGVVTNQISWREPAQVNDSVSTTVPAGTAGNPITVDGASITDGQRVLFSAITSGGGPNVYIYNQTTGLFVEDTNNESAGDTLYIIDGTDAGKRFTFNGTAWVLLDVTSLDELGYIRAFIGKSAAGNVLPTYTSTTQVANSDDLEVAIGKLDGAIGGQPTTNTIISNTNTANANIQALADYVESNNLNVVVNNVTTITTIDSVVSSMTKWIVRCQSVATPANVYAVEVFAMHNGTNPDHTNYAALKLGSTISGLVINVTLTGGNTLNLTVVSTAAVNVTAKRVAAV